MKTVICLALLLVSASPLAAIDVLPGTQPLTWDGDISLKMVDDLHAFADRETAASIARRARHWNRDLSSVKANWDSLLENRSRLRKYLGEIWDESDTEFESIRELQLAARAHEHVDFTIELQYFPTNDGILMEAVVLTPKEQITRINPHDINPWTVILIPDASESAEDYVGKLQQPNKPNETARRLLESGYRVVIPMIVDRTHDHSVVANGLRKTLQPHREFIYRQAFEMGRHILGYELKLIGRLVDQFGSTPNPRTITAINIGIMGYGEGGLLALYAAALDPRIGVVGVSGYFGPRERLWEEPIYRNVWGLLGEFGDAELAAMIAPRKLIIEASQAPEVKHDDSGTNAGRVTPGFIVTPELSDVRSEISRANRLIAEANGPKDHVKLVVPKSGDSTHFTDEFLRSCLLELSQSDELINRDYDTSAAPQYTEGFRRSNLIKRIIDHTQALMRESEYVRKDFWKNADRASRDPEKWRASLKPYRDHLYDEVLGRFDLPKLPPNARTRKVDAYDTPKYTGYEVVLDVFGADGEHVDVWAYGVLLVPKDLKPGERRPVVVCQHGLEGRPQHTIDAVAPGEAPYHHFAAQLAERGFVVFAPQNPYIGKDHFRQLVRKLYPLKKTLWSVIVPQHEQITDWLASLEFVDPDRIGFYGLSYGGKTAMRVPALVERYCLSICSGDFNEWIRNNVSVRDTYSYMQTHEYEMYEFDLGHTFNYAEMAYLIAPRPFMVERGHRDGVGVDEWVSYEFAKVRMLYADLKVPERTEIEYFDGPHTIHGVGTFDFLHRHLKWPAPTP